MVAQAVKARPALLAGSPALWVLLGMLAGALLALSARPPPPGARGLQRAGGCWQGAACLYDKRETAQTGYRAARGTGGACRPPSAEVAPAPLRPA